VDEGIVGEEEGTVGTLKDEAIGIEEETEADVEEEQSA
jgi:hypothetical protein